MALSRSKLKEIARALKVTDHSDYRTFLRLVYAEAKVVDDSYSFVRFSDDLGLGSTNAHSVIQGRRPLTVKAAERICESLGLAGLQKRYFLALVAQSRAKSTSDRDAVFQERLKLKQQVLPNEIDRRQLAFFENWYNAAILELLRLDNSSDDAQWIADHLSPAVPLAKVRESLRLLLDLGYIAIDRKLGRLFPTEATISTGNDVSGMAIHSFHRQMIKLALDAIDDVASENRDISAVTIAISKPLEEQLKEDLVALRKRYLQLAADDKHPTEIVQLNIQVFPLVKQRRTQS